AVGAGAEEHPGAEHAEGQPPAHDAAPGHDEEKVDPSTYILHHVSDENEFSFQVPLSNREFVIHFPVWRIPLKEGACPADKEAPASLRQRCLDLSITN